MIEHYINTLLIPLLKISFINILFNINFVFKLIFLFILYVVSKILLKAISFKPHASKVVDYYKIQSQFDKILTFFMIFLYFLFFVLGIFILRYNNKNKSYDLFLLFNNIKDQFEINPLNALLSYIIILLFIIIFILIIVKITKIFKRYFIKFHLYYNTENFSEMYPKFLARLIDISYVKYLNYLQRHYDSLNLKIFGFTVYHHLRVLIPKLHYILLIFFLLYEICFNHGVIEIVYKALLYSYIYHMYMKLIHVDDDLDLLYNADTFLHLLLYKGGSLELINETEAYFTNDEIMRTYSLEIITLYVQVYLKYELNGPLLHRMINKDPSLIYPGHYTYYKK